MGERTLPVQNVALPYSGGARYNPMARVVRGDGLENAVRSDCDSGRSDRFSCAFEGIEGMAVRGGDSMKIRLGTMLAAAAVIISAAPMARAQSVAEVVNAIDHARVVTRVLYVDAHPDDERESVLTYLSKGLGDDVALC